MEQPNEYRGYGDILTMAQAERYSAERVPEEQVDMEIRDAFLDVWTQAAFSDKYSKVQWRYLRNLLGRKGISI